jgi:hypothetical protein
MQTERWVVAVVLVLGFLWLHRRAKGLDEAARGRALKGTILFLAPALIGGKWAFERLPFGFYQNLMIEVAALVAVIAVAGVVFMTEKKGNG